MRKRREAKQWAAIVAACKKSGKSVPEFCAERRIRISTFRWWRWRLRDMPVAAGPARAPSPADEVRLIPVDVVGLAAARVRRSTSVEICVANVSVRVDVGTDAAYVAALMAELRSRC